MDHIVFWIDKFKSHSTKSQFTNSTNLKLQNFQNWDSYWFTKAQHESQTTTMKLEITKVTWEKKIIDYPKWHKKLKNLKWIWYDNGELKFWSAFNLNVYNLDVKSFKVHESWFTSSFAHFDIVKMNFLPTQNLNLWTILISKYHPTLLKATKSHDHYFVMLIIHHIDNPLPLINHKLSKFIQFLNLK